MAKNSKRKLLFTTAFLTILLSSSAYAALMPTINAAELTAQQKGLSVLSNVVGLDLTKYDVVTEEKNLYPQNLDRMLQETVLYNFTSVNSKLRTFCTFTNGNLQEIYVLEKEGTLSLNKPMVSINDIQRAHRAIWRKAI